MHLFNNRYASIVSYKYGQETNKKSGNSYEQSHLFHVLVLHIVNFRFRI